MPDRIGQQLGNYRLVRMLGHGGFAEVYLGEHRYLKSYAALKVLRTSLKGKEIDQFLSEAQTLVRLRHPNIVRVLDYAVDRGTPVLIMDYAPGGTLRRHYPRGTCLSLATTVSYIKQIADALQYAHNHNIIHRDVKPENILLGTDRQLLLSDFGLALLALSPELLTTQGLAGTLPYTAPEQLNGKPTFASDQYALAIIAYEWLCGKRPFEGAQWELINQHMSIPPPSMRQAYPELPIEVESVILRALAKDPQQRFPSVQSFALTLERAAHDPHVDRLDSLDDTPITAVLREKPQPLPSISADRTAQSIFLSASSADEEFVSRLRSDLQTRGFIVSNESSASTQRTLNADEEESARQGIRAAHLVLVVVSPHTPSSHTVKEHLRIASMYERQLVFFWADGNDITAVLPEEWGKTASIDLIDARQDRYQRALDQFITALEEKTTDLPELTPSTLSGEPRNPYKGLRAFTKDDTADFFGRDILIQDLLEAVKGMLSSTKPRLLAVIGPSGSGKSSVVMAGLLPRFQKGVLSGSAGWVYPEPIVPGEHPLESLAIALAPHLPGQNPSAIRQYLYDESRRGLALLATQMVKQPGARVLFVIDQFEELFTQAISERERRQFIHTLVTAVTEPRCPLIVILTMRADFYDRPMAYPALGRSIQNHHRVVFPMDLQDLRAVIEQPAALPDVQLTFEGNLVGDLLFETQGQPGALPLLEFTLDQLFQGREGHWLTQDAYQAIGGVKGALAKHAEATYLALPSDEHRRLARALFLRLIDPGATEQDTTRRRAALTKLSLPNPKQTTIMREAADAFTAARLLTTAEVAGIKTIEVSHEALIREWSRLAEWLREAREDIVLQQAISTDASEWLRRGKPEDRLYRGTRLVEAQVWAERNLPSIDEVAFLEASSAEHQRREVLEQIRQARELTLQRRSVNRLRVLVAALSIFSVVVIVLALLAEGNFQQAQSLQKQASLQAQIATSRALAAQSGVQLAQGRVDQALLLSLKAAQTYNTYEARDSLLNALEYSPRLLTVLQAQGKAPVGVMAFLPNRQTLFSLDDNGTVTYWNVKTRRGHTLQLDLRGLAAGIVNWAFSPNGQIVAGANNQGLWLWNGNNGAKIASLETQTPGVTLYDTTSIAFSPDGTALASGRCTNYDAAGNCRQGRLLLWNVATQNSKLLFNSASLVTSLAFSPDGQTLIASTQALSTGSSNGSIQFWNVATRKETNASFANYTGIASNIALSPDGKTLAAINSNDDSVYLWNVASQKATGLPLSVKGVQSITFSPDSKTLYTGGTDKTVQLWDITAASPSSGIPFPGHKDSITSITFSPDGTMLASGDSSGAILLWNLTAKSNIQQQLSYSERVFSAAFSPDSETIATGNDRGMIGLQDAATGKQLATLDATLGPVVQENTANNDAALTVESLAFSPDGHALAAGRFDGMILVWNTATKQLINHFRSNEKHLKNIFFSPDNHVLAASYDDGVILLWDTGTGHILQRFMHPPLNSDAISTMAFSPDGKLLASGANNTVIFWDTATGKPAGQPLKAPKLHTVKSVAFSPNGQTLAAIDDNNQIMLWNTGMAKPLLNKPISNDDPDLTNEIPNPTGLAFSSDGQMLAAGGDQSLSVWDVTTLPARRIGHPFHTLVNDVTNPYANMHSVAFSPDAQHIIAISDTFSGNYAVTLWNANLHLWQAAACSIANRNFTLDEWSAFVGGTPYQKVCPTLPVDGTVIQDQLAQAHADTQAGQTQDAQALYQQAEQEAIQLNDAFLNNNVCWDGSTDDFAQQVSAACDRAIALDQYNGEYYDSRGVARALTGNRQGAINDFNFFIQWATNEYLNVAGTDPGTQAQYKQRIAERTAWLQQLKAGHNPFDTKTLQALRIESGIDQ